MCTMLEYKIGDRVVWSQSHFRKNEYESTIIGIRKNDNDTHLCEYIVPIDGFGPKLKFGFIVEKPHIINCGCLTNYDGVDEKYLGKKILAVSQSDIIGFAKKQKCKLCLNIK